MASTRNRTNHLQTTYLVQFMESNYIELFGDSSEPDAPKIKQDFWHELTVALNTMGPPKSATGWKKAWSYLRQQASLKVSLIQKRMNTNDWAENDELDDRDKFYIRISQVDSKLNRESYVCDVETGKQIKCAEVFQTPLGEFIFFCIQCQVMLGQFDAFVEHMKTHCIKPNVNENLPLDPGNQIQNYTYSSVPCDQKLEILTEEQHKLDMIKSDPHQTQIKDETLSNDEADDPLYLGTQFEIPEPSVGSELECIKCNKQLKNRKNLQQHLRRHARNPNWVQSKCPYDHCNRIFSSEDGMQRHISHYHIEVQCDECSRLFPSKLYLDKHKPIHNRQLECDICHKFFGTRESIKSHMIMHSKVKNKVCAECGECFQYSNTYIKHKLMHEGKVREKKRVCHLCGAKYVSAFHLREHLNMHAGIRDQKCTKCDKAFFRRKHLRVHMHRTHTEVPPYKCRHCSMRFRNPDTRKRHEKREHVNELTQVYLNECE